MKVLWLDNWYPDAYAAWQKTGGPWLHGTADFWDIALRAAGHESQTHLINSDPHWQIAVGEFKPDVICSQNIGMWGAYEGSPLSEFRRFMGCKLVGFCSYAANEQTYLGWDALFTSFPHLVDHVRSLGTRCEYLPLAFGRPVLDRIGELPKERDIPVAFIGGLGSRIWEQGTKTMAAIAEACDGHFSWWGYWVGPEEMPPALKRAYICPAYGLEMYRILARTKIFLNRHGEIARAFGNNLRQYEATAMGCMLLTDHAGELVGHGIESGLEFCATYSSTEDAIESIHHWINPRGANIGGSAPGRSQEFVLAHHTYEARVPHFLEVVESL